MFRTPITLAPSTHLIGLESKILSMGSCFAEFIGGALVKNKFKILNNPFGVIFHPLALFKVLELALQKDLPPDHSYVRNQGIWYNYLFHGSVSHTSREALKKLVKIKLLELEAYLHHLDYLMITFGTALQYRHIDTDLVVANCHKAPQQEFVKSLTPVDAVVRGFNQLWSTWGHHKPRVILSVSPIRHVKEGLVNNSLSKSVLRVASEHIAQIDDRVEYFPGFEIMMDDLRDYRFFEDDMVHPNQTARDYIWKLFADNYLNDHAGVFIDQWHKISNNLEHRPFYPQSPAHQAFLQKTLKLIDQLPENVDVSGEIDWIKKQLI